MQARRKRRKMADCFLFGHLLWFPHGVRKPALQASFQPRKLRIAFIGGRWCGFKIQWHRKATTKRSGKDWRKWGHELRRTAGVTSHLRGREHNWHASGEVADIRSSIWETLIQRFSATIHVMARRCDVRALSRAWSRCFPFIPRPCRQKTVDYGPRADWRPKKWGALASRYYRLESGLP